MDQQQHPKGRCPLTSVRSGGNSCCRRTVHVGVRDQCPAFHAAPQPRNAATDSPFLCSQRMSSGPSLSEVLVKCQVFPFLLQSQALCRPPAPHSSATAKTPSLIPPYVPSSSPSSQLPVMSPKCLICHFLVHLPAQRLAVTPRCCSTPSSIFRLDADPGL